MFSSKLKMVHLHKRVETCLKSILILIIWLPLFSPFGG